MTTNLPNGFFDIRYYLNFCKGFFLVGPTGHSAGNGGQEGRQSGRLVLTDHRQGRNAGVLRRVRMLHPPAMGLLHLGGHPEVLRRRNQEARRRELLLPNFCVTGEY